MGPFFYVSIVDKVLLDRRTDGVISPHTDPMRDGTILPHLLRQFLLPHTDLKFTESENNP